MVWVLGTEVRAAVAARLVLHNQAVSLSFVPFFWGGGMLIHVKFPLLGFFLKFQAHCSSCIVNFYIFYIFVNFLILFLL